MVLATIVYFTSRVYDMVVYCDEIVNCCLDDFPCKSVADASEGIVNEFITSSVCTIIDSVIDSLCDDPRKCILVLFGLWTRDDQYCNEGN